MNMKKTLKRVLMPRIIQVLLSLLIIGTLVVEAKEVRKITDLSLDEINYPAKQVTLVNDLLKLSEIKHYSPEGYLTIQLQKREYYSQVLVMSYQKYQDDARYLMNYLSEEYTVDELLNTSDLTVLDLPVIHSIQRWENPQKMVQTIENGEILYYYNDQHQMIVVNNGESGREQYYEYLEDNTEPAIEDMVVNILYRSVIQRDEYGSWIERVSYLLDPSTSDRKIIATEERDIIYYE